MPKTSTNQLGVTDRDLRRAAVWLSNHRFVGVAPTALLAARLAMRRRTKIGLAVAGVVLMFPYLIAVGWALTQPHLDTAAAMPRLLSSIAAILAVLVIRGLGMWRTSREERHLAAALPVRTARPVRFGLRQLLGVSRWFAIITHGGSLALIIAVIAAGSSAEARNQAWISFAAIVAMLAICAIEVHGILRRPALAEDEMSLRVDDVLRAEEATLVVNPIFSAAVIMQSGLQASDAWVTLTLPPLLILAAVYAVLATTTVNRAGQWNARAVTTRS